MGRMDEMGGRLDELEKSISSLMDQANLQPTTGTLVPGREGAVTEKNTESDGSVSVKVYSKWRGCATRSLMRLSVQVTA